MLVPVSARAQTVVYQNTTTPLAVAEVNGETYLWELYNDLNVNFTTNPGNCPPTSAGFESGNTGANVVVRWLQTGIYYYKVTAQDAVQCTRNFKIGMFKVIPVELEAIITGDTLTGACHQVELDASKSAGDIIKYEWSIIDQGGLLTHQTGISTQFQLAPSFEGTLPADFGVKLTVTNGQGFTHSDTIIIRVDRMPVAEVFTSGQPEKDGTIVIDGAISTGTVVNYRWYTSEGKIVGPANESTVKLFGAGIYTLEITDKHGCTSSKDFKFPLELYHISIYPDYARISITKDTILNVLANDESTIDLVPGTVRVVKSPLQGVTQVNTNGTITYTPRQTFTGRDQFDYEVCDVLNLCSSATVTIDIDDISIIIPGAFSPNGDGLNEHLEYGRLEKYPGSQLYIYTRSGQLVYQSNDYKNDWDGTALKGTITSQQYVPTGTYYYTLKPGGIDRLIKGFIYIAY